jgi:hypothetical protein
VAEWLQKGFRLVLGYIRQNSELQVSITLHNSLQPSWFFRKRCSHHWPLPGYNLLTMAIPHTITYSLTAVSRLFIIKSSQSLSHVTTDGQSGSTSWCRTPSGSHDQIFVYCWTITVVSLWGALSDERSGLLIVSQSLHYLVICQYIYKYLYFRCLTYKFLYIHYNQGLCQSGLSRTIYAP